MFSQIIDTSQDSQEEFVTIDVCLSEKEVSYSFPADTSLWDYVGRGSFGCVLHHMDPASSLDLAIKAIPTTDNGRLNSLKFHALMWILLL